MVVQQPQQSLRISSLRPTQEIITFLPASSSSPSSTITSNTNNATATLTSPTSTKQLCSICHINSSQYTCPRCYIPYCSLSCYQKHDTDTTGNVSSSSCTEIFYEHHVTQILQLEMKEQSDTFQQQLVQYSINNNTTSKLNTLDGTNILDETHNKVDDSDSVTSDQLLSREELQQIWSIIEQFENEEEEGENDASTNKRSKNYNKDNDDDDDDIKLLYKMLQTKCSTRTQRIIQNAIQQLTRPPTTAEPTNPKNTIHTATESITEWILEPWSPWWSSSLTSIGLPHPDDDSNDDNDNDDNTNQNDINLDERLLSIPKFHTLYRIKKKMSDSTTNDSITLLLQPSYYQYPQIQYNIIDILYATVFTLRLYHGINNIGIRNQEQKQQQQLVLDAAMTLTNTSYVLSNDARYTTLEAVLMDCCNVQHPIIAQQQRQQKKNNIDDQEHDPIHYSTLLLQDVAQIYSNYRYVVRALLEASDILQFAIVELKKGNNTNNLCSFTNHSNDEQKQLRHHLQKIHKKIVFYISWTIAVTKEQHNIRRNRRQSTKIMEWPYQHIELDIINWIEQWQLPRRNNK